MNYITQFKVVDLVSIRTGTASISLAGTDVKKYEGKVKIVVSTQGDASVVATLQQNDVSTHNDAGWADVKDAAGTTISVTPGTTNATTTSWDVNIADLKRYIRVKFTDASTVYAVLIGMKKYPS